MCGISLPTGPFVPKRKREEGARPYERMQDPTLTNTHKSEVALGKEKNRASTFNGKVPQYMPYPENILMRRGRLQFFAKVWRAVKIEGLRAGSW